MSEQAIEQQIQQKGLNAPRITPDHIDSKIKRVHYHSPLSAVDHTQAMDEGTYQHLRCLTFCTIILENGFTVTGESACASPENFDPFIGKEIALQNAREKIWQLEGYLLKQKLYEESKPTTFQERVISEQIELQSKLDALNALLVKGQPEFIDDENWQLLNDQHKHMTEYNVTLMQRIASFLRNELPR